ncbi:MAG: DNRLRE domain-containing protein, partial [Verrucomicrobia bacterium]|nr:DNRLRE domain-containing protein [Verrucomicrobiota bacterium]
HFTPAPAYTAGNRTYTDVVVAVRGVIVKDAAKLALARDGLSPVFPYTWFEGFHVDGSFIQHTAFPYNGGYGSALLKDLGNTMWLLKGSTWELTDPAQANSYRWVAEAYEPFIYKGACMDIVRGRGSSRSGEDHAEGHSIMQSLLRWTQLAPSGDALTFKQMLKYWMQQDTYRNFVSNIGNINLLLLAQAIRDDGSITPRGELVAHRQFPEMDRVVHLRPGFGLALSMFSTRIKNYESINNENLKGWYSADGMTYLYNGDLKQFSDSFWPTVNKYRLPGTTVDTLALANGQGQGSYGSQSWVGGAEIRGSYGVAGMSLDSVYGTLTAKKSWFMFDDEVVALGSGITSADGRTIETIVENRKLTTAGNNALTVNGVAKPATLGWSEQMAGVSWIHLSSNAPGNHIAYYFPGGATLNGLREARTGSWRDINAGGSTNLVTRNYMTLWFDHGANPAGATYAYVMLPGKTTNEVSAYAANPHITILENSVAAQAVRETNLNITAVNFWQDAPKTVSYITCDRQAAVIAQEAPGELEVSVSDPTQANATVRQLTAIADSYVRGGIYSNENHGTETSMVVMGSSPDFTRHSYMKFDLTGAASFSSALLKVTANSAANGASTVSLYSVTVDSWTETGLTWSNRPPAVTLLGSANVTTNGQTLSFDVTSFVAGQLSGDGTASFVIVPANNDDQYLTFYSRESGFAPRLELSGVTGGGAINIELNRYATGILSNDSRVTITQLAPTIKLSVNVDAYPYNSDAANGIRGHSWKAKFAVDNAPPVLLAAASRKTHGAAGTFDVPLTLDPAANPTVEPRVGGPNTLVLTFSKNIVAADGTLSANEFTLTNATFSAASVSASNLTLNLAGIPDQSRVTVVLNGLTDPYGVALAGANAVVIRALYGDVNQSGSVSVGDMQAVKNKLLQVLSSANFLCDVNCSGSITVGDMQVVKNNLTHTVTLGSFNPITPSLQFSITPT